MFRTMMPSHLPVGSYDGVSLWNVVRVRLYQPDAGTVATTVR